MTRMWSIVQDIFQTPEGWAVSLAIIWSLGIEYFHAPSHLLADLIPGGGLTPGMLWAGSITLVLAKLRPSGGATPFQPITVEAPSTEAGEKKTL